MEMPSIESCSPSTEICNKIKSLVDQIFDGSSHIDELLLKEFIEKSINPLYFEIFVENIDLDKVQLKIAIDRYNATVDSIKYFHTDFIKKDSIEHAKRMLSLFFEFLFTSKNFSDKMKALNNNNKQVIGRVLGQKGQKVDNTWIDAISDDDYPSSGDTLKRTNKSKGLEKIPVDGKKLSEDHTKLQGEYDCLIRASLNNQSYNNNITLYYNYDNPNGYTNFPLHTAVTKEGKHHHINLRSENIRLWKAIQIFRKN